MALGKAFLRLMAWIYFAGFAFVVFVSHVPVFNDAEGKLFGLFQIDLRDDFVHILSAITGAVVAATGRWIRPYFWATAALYGLDALVGLTTELGLLDLSVFSEPWRSPDFGLRNIALNAPHIVIAVVAVYVALGASSAPAAHVEA